MARRRIQEKQNQRLYTRGNLWGQGVSLLVVSIGVLACLTMMGSGIRGSFGIMPVPTADDFNWLPYVILLLVSGAGVLILALWRLLKGNRQGSSRK